MAATTGETGAGGTTDLEARGSLSPLSLRRRRALRVRGRCSVAFQQRQVSESELVFQPAAEPGRLRRVPERSVFQQVLLLLQQLPEPERA